MSDRAFPDLLTKRSSKEDVRRKKKRSMYMLKEVLGSHLSMPLLYKNFPWTCQVRLPIHQTRLARELSSSAQIGSRIL